MFVEAWVSKVRHFSYTTASRVEDLHAFLKQFISSSVGDLLTVTQELTLAIEHQINELSKIHLDDREKRDFAARIGVFNDIVYIVSRHALSLVNHHCIKTSGNLLCRSIFLTTMGLPCVHVVNSRVQHQNCLAMVDFDSHWHLNRGDGANSAPREAVSVEEFDHAYTQLRDVFIAAITHTKLELHEQLQDMIKSGPKFRFHDPEKACTRGRLLGAANKQKLSVRREPSGFELVEGSSSMRRTCGACGLYGHNSRICAKLR